MLPFMFCYHAYHVNMKPNSTFFTTMRLHSAKSWQCKIIRFQLQCSFFVCNTDIYFTMLVFTENIPDNLWFLMPDNSYLPEYSKFMRNKYTGCLRKWISLLLRRVFCELDVLHVPSCVSCWTSTVNTTFNTKSGQCLH